MDNIDLKLLGCFLDFSNVSLVVLVCRGGSGVIGKVDIKVIDDIREEFQL